MHHSGFRLSQIFWTACACLFLLSRVASAQPVRAIDFDGDGQRDRFTIERHDPSLISIWLSGSNATQFIRSRAPLVRVVVGDLDDDHWPELIALDSHSQLYVWTHRHGGFRSYRTRHRLPDEIARRNPRHVNDADADAPAAIASATFTTFAPALSATSLPVPLEPSAERAVHGVPLCLPLATVTPFAPRPPPARFRH